MSIDRLDMNFAESNFSGNSRASLNDRNRAIDDPIPDPTAGITVGDSNTYLTDDLSFKDRELMKDFVRRRQAELQPLDISKVTVHVMSPEEIARLSQVEVTSGEESGNFSVNDPKMGCETPGEACQTCGDANVCAGHTGHIRLNYLVYHPFYVRSLAEILTCLCPSCGKLLPTQEELKELNLGLYPGEQRFQIVANFVTAGRLTCRNGCTGGTRNYISTKKPTQVTKLDIMTVAWITGAKSKNTKKNFLDPYEARQILRSFEYKDINRPELGWSDEPSWLGFLRRDDGSYMTKPSNWITENVVVLPPWQRASMEVDGRKNLDQLTRLYIFLVQQNNKLRPTDDRTITAIPTDPAQLQIYEAIEATYNAILNGKGNGDDAEIESLAHRLKGKEGLVRRNMLGKRTNYNARTVANPEASVEFGEVLVPRCFNQKLTVREMVTNINQDYLQGLLEIGSVKNFIPGHGSMKGKLWKVTRAIRRDLQLQIGDEVDRIIDDGDACLLNRQPSLHKQSMVGHKVKLSEDEDTKVLGLHLGATSGLNADFDGDEVNLHIPQTLQAKIEAKTIANVEACILNSSTNKNIASPVFDALAAAYKLTQPQTVLTEAQFLDLGNGAFPDGNFNYEKHRYKMKQYGVPLYSGLSAFSITLPDGFYYEKDEVLVMDGVMMRGIVSKAHIGGAHRSIVQALYHWSDNDNQIISEYITRTTFMLIKYMTIDPTTVGLSDCMNIDPDAHENRVKIEIARMKKAVLALAGDRDMSKAEAERLEREILAWIEQPAGKINKTVMGDLDPDNSFMISLNSGAKGSKFNLQQIMGILGQQFMRGERPNYNLPYFQEGSQDPEARGFITNSFFGGLNLPDYIFHVASSRFGVLDTATKVSDTGSTQRLLMKFMENYRVSPDGSVVDAVGNIISYGYGVDGFEAANLVQQPSAIGPVVSFMDLSNETGRLNNKYGYP